VVDDAGRRVVLHAPAARIVSLAPSLTELLFAVGAAAQVVGRTDWADFPVEVAAIRSVGDGLSPNVEMIVSCRPDLVLFYASPSNDVAIAQLERAGVATASLKTDDVADLMRVTRLVGRLSGHETQADSLVSWLETEISMLREARYRSVRRSVLILAWDNPPIVVGGGSFLSEIVELAGAKNLFGDVDRPSLTVSIEAVAERNPDVVLVASDSGLPGWVQRPEWQSIPAVRHRRFVVVQGSEFSRPSYRAPAAVRRLRSVLAELQL
jgi:ABC-type Fe3+-hydroxamate transport system substrate-binding protein